MREIDLARRGVHPLGHVHELVYQFLHFRQHPGFGRQEDLGRGGVDGAVRQLVQALAHDPHALAHLLHAHPVAIVAIAPGAHRHFKLQLVIHQVRVRLAQIVRHAAGAQVGAGQPVIYGHLPRDHSHSLRPVHKNAVAGQERLRLLDIHHHLVKELPALLDPPGRQIARQPPNARIGGGEPRPRQRLAQVVNLFALGEGMEEDRHRPAVHRVAADAQQMRRKARQLGADHADILAARRQLPLQAQQFLDRQRVGDVVGHRRQVIQPVRVGNELGVGAILGDLLVAAVQVADLGPHPGNPLAVQFDHQAQHPVRGRVRRPHVQNHPVPGQIPRFRLGRRRGGTRRGRGRPRGRVLELKLVRLGHV